jgi:magnesium transporter
MAKAKVKEEEKEKEGRPNIEEITWGDLTWVNISPPTENETDYLAKRFNFHQLALDDCLSRKQLPKLDVYPGYLFFIFHFPLYDKVTRISTKRQWSAFIGENFIVTIHTGELKTLVALFRDCQVNEESRQEYFSHGSGYLLYRILDRAIDSYFPVLDKILSLMEDAEDSVFDEEVEAARELSILRRDIITQRSVMFPTRAIFIEMENKLMRFAKTDVTAYYNDLMDHMNKICETLDECKELIEVYKDTDNLLSTYRLNRITRTLTVFGAIVLPFLVISGLYGMNVILPGGIEGGGSHDTFLLLLLAMFIIIGIMLYIFRRKHLI